MLQMRKRLTALLAALLLVIGLCSTTAQAAGVTVLVNGKTLSGAQLIGGTTYVPFKSFCTAMHLSLTEQERPRAAIRYRRRRGILT